MKSLTTKQMQDYRDSLNRHIECVTEVGKRLGVPEAQLVYHDASKFSTFEYPHYVREYFGEADDPKGYTRAWLHHIHHNPHHWQHWMFPDNFDREGADLVNGIMEMPKNYALEMVADWAGSSKAYTGSWDMSGWLKENRFKVHLHPNTAKFVISTILRFGFCRDSILVGVEGVFSAQFSCYLSIDTKKERRRG